MEPWLPDSRILRSVAGAVLRRAEALSVKLGRRLRVMEVCGTHTAAITRSGLRELLAAAIEFRSGPGCPVCVTPDGDLRAIRSLAGTPGVMLASPGDLMRVPLPGGAGSLQTVAAQRKADVRVVVSPIQALDLAATHPDHEVVLLAPGFETTSPTTAAAVLRAAAMRTGNLSLLVMHKLMPPALRAVLRRGGDREALGSDRAGNGAGDRGGSNGSGAPAATGAAIDGLLLPGHVSIVTGRQPFEFIASESGTPAVIAGFEPGDLLLALNHLLDQVEAGPPRVVNAYPRAVGEQGNRAAQQLTSCVFEPCPSDWRGLGQINDSGLAIRCGYGRFDARLRFGLLPCSAAQERSDAGCRCGDVVTGRIDPPDCPLFGSACLPASPRGPCMVSAEGACQIASMGMSVWPKSELQTWSH